MANNNGETFSEIRKILETEKSIPAKIATRLTLAALADLRDNQLRQDIRIDEVERNSIVLWAKNNKIIAGILIILIASAPADAIYGILQFVSSHLK